MPNGSLGSGASRGSAARKQPDLGVDATLNGFQIFDAKSLWNKSVDKSAVDPNSDKIIAKVGKDKPLLVGFGANRDGKPFGIPYTVVSGDAPRVAINFTSKDADAGPYPYPLMMPIEPAPADAKGAGRAIVIDRDALKAYETSETAPDGVGYKANSGAIWDLRSDIARKPGLLSAESSGMPILPGLVRVDETIDQKSIPHVLEFTLGTLRKGYVPPATRSVGMADEAEQLPAGAHLRLKKDFDVSKYPESARTILKALKKYGMILAEQGPDLQLMGTPDLKWSDKDLATLGQLKASDFEVLKLPEVQGLKDDASAIKPTAPAASKTEKTDQSSQPAKP